jgi:hypothetical protein
MIAHNNMHESEGLLGDAKKFIALIYFKHPVTETTEMEGTGEMSSIRKRYFVDDESFAEKLASLRLKYKEPVCQVLIRLPIHLICQSHAEPPDALQDCQSARDIYVQDMDIM